MAPYQGHTHDHMEAVNTLKSKATVELVHSWYTEILQGTTEHIPVPVQRVTDTGIAMLT